MISKDSFYPRFYYKDNKLKQLKGFVTVAKYQSIRKAAEELNLTHGAISTQIASLEKQLGCKLFDRTSKKIDLNESGKKLYEMAIAKLQGIDSLYDEFILQSRYKSENHIKIAGHNFVLSHYLNKYLAQIIEKHQNNIKFTILNIPLTEATDKIVNEEIDLMLYDIDELHHPAIEVKPWICEEFVAISAKKYDMFKKKDNKITWEDIYKADIIRTGSEIVTKAAETFINKDNFSNIANYINPSYEICKNASLSGLGVTFCPKSYISETEKRIVKIKDVSHLLGFYKANIGFKKNTKMKILAKELIKILTA
jgi:DNA-binding transcriptional LysR family regulator